MLRRSSIAPPLAPRVTTKPLRARPQSSLDFFPLYYCSRLLLSSLAILSSPYFQIAKHVRNKLASFTACIPFLVLFLSLYFIFVVDNVHHNHPICPLCSAFQRVPVYSFYISYFLSDSESRYKCVGELFQIYLVLTRNERIVPGLIFDS